MVSSLQRKPRRMGTRELWDLIEEKVREERYVFLNHAKQRLSDRGINDLSVLNILSNQKGYARRRNKNKDIYITGRNDWNYCIEGKDLSRSKIRVIVSFDWFLLLVVTVIRLESEE